MATSAIKGLNVVVKVGATAVAGQRGATLNRSAETIDITNKVSAGWKESLASFKEWSVDCDGIFVVDDTALESLETSFLAGTAVTLEISSATDTWGYTGDAIITDFPIEAPYDDATTYSVSFTGTGALAAKTFV